MSNTFGMILAGGSGSRMGNIERPKQFMELGGKPILIHTVEKFAVNSSFEKIIVLTPKTWIKYTEDVLKRHLPMFSQIVVIEGGDTRNETIMNGIKYIETTSSLDEHTIIVTHDAVRPFVTHRIIEENIHFASMYGATDTVIAATDTIVESQDNEFITDIPNRSKLYQGQTPQSFKAKMLKDYYESLNEDQKAILTDACKICLLKGQKVYLVEGETFNMKVTYPTDLKLAEALLEVK